MRYGTVANMHADTNFWQKLKKPFYMVAPMEDVTDAAFRAIIAQYSKLQGASYVTFTEFVSVDGLLFADAKGQKKLRSKLKYGAQERPIVAQLFATKPEYMEQGARIVQDMGFDGVDINMGCPDRSIEKQGCGASLIQDPQRALAMIEAAKQGANNIPVSVKTRIGYADNEIETWLPTLLSARPALITIHGRTRKELSKVPARWDVIERAVQIRDVYGSDTLIAGNGDIASIMDARLHARQYGVDGVMIGRGIFGNPWGMSDYRPTHTEKMQVLIEHTHLFEKEFTDIKSFATMRKHFGSYIGVFPGAKELRGRLMRCENAQEVETVLRQQISENKKLSS